MFPLKSLVLVLLVRFISSVYGDQTVENAVLEVLPCFLKQDMSLCLQNSTRRSLDSWNNVVGNKWNDLAAEAGQETSRNLWTQRSLYDTPRLARSLRDDFRDVYSIITSGIRSFWYPEESMTLRQARNDEESSEEFSPEIEGIDEDEPSAFANKLTQAPRGKKKKKAALMKLFLVGALIKSKIELLLKLLSAHMQFKFLAVAVVGLLINVARFFLDLKKAWEPQKVVYYEHAQHEHHYDHEHEPAHGGSGSGWGGFWKRRSLDTAATAQDLAYRGQVRK